MSLSANAAEDGTIKWFNADYNVAHLYADGTIYASLATSVVNGWFAINPDGTQKWFYPCEYCLPEAIATDGTIYSGSLDGGLHAINPDGSLKWDLQFQGWSGGRLRPPAIGADGTIYVANRDGVSSINPDGTLKWGPILPELADNNTLSYLSVGADGTVYVGSSPHVWSSGRIDAINPDGTQKWSFPLEGGTWQQPHAIDADGTIYVASGQWPAVLHAINPDGTKSGLFLSRKEVYGPAIGADGTIYVGEWNVLHAINPDGN